MRNKKDRAKTEAEAAEESRKALLRKILQAEIEAAEKLQSVVRKKAEDLRRAREEERHKWLKAKFKAAEKLKLWNPVRRAIWIAGFAVCVVLLWILKLQLAIYFAKSDYRTTEKRVMEIAGLYNSATDYLNNLDQINQQLAALDRLANRHFTWEPFITNLLAIKVEDILITRCSVAQNYTEEEPRAIANSSNNVANPGAMVERMTVNIYGRDFSSNHEALIKYEACLNSNGYFVENLKRGGGFDVLDMLKPALADDSDPTNHFVVFVLAAHFPEKRHN